MKIIDKVEEFFNHLLSFNYLKLNYQHLHLVRNKLYDYNTVIAQIIDKDCKPLVILNLTKYSNTTTRVQNTIINLLTHSDINKEIVFRVPKNTDDLCSYYKAQQDLIF